MLPKNWGEPMGAPAIFGKQIEIKLLHPTSTEDVTDSGSNQLSRSISISCAIPLIYSGLVVLITGRMPAGCLRNQASATTLMRQLCRSTISLSKDFERYATVVSENKAPPPKGDQAIGKIPSRCSGLRSPSVKASRCVRLSSIWFRARGGFI
ncbi:MAG: hypothetical protein P8X74_07860 [Reinekea sp.]